MEMGTFDNIDWEWSILVNPATFLSWHTLYIHC